MRINKIIVLFVFVNFLSFGQDTICINETINHRISSKYLEEERDYWVSLPLGYSNDKSYPVIYVLDAEWRFELIRNIAFDLGANEKIKNSIIVGIPHLDWKKKRGQDLTFSQSRVEYDGDKVDSTWFNSSNSGFAMSFFNYFIKELIPDVNSNYSTNNHETFIGHSYGGYFGAYILSLDHPFEVLHLYDPSIWYGNGETTDRIKAMQNRKKVKVYLTYQPNPDFHKMKIEKFVDELSRLDGVELFTKFYSDETHNSLFLDSFYHGIFKTNPF